MIARVAIQCANSEGKVGSFLFKPGTRPFVAVSPVMPDLVALYDWCRANGWTALPYNPAAPCGEYAKDA